MARGKEKKGGSLTKQPVDEAKMTEAATGVQPVRTKVSRKISAKRLVNTKTLLAVLIVAILGAGGYAGYRAYKQATLPANVKESQATVKLNEAFRKNDKTQALADAKQALAAEPHDIDAILAVAYLTQQQDPAQAKQYFAQALAEFKLQNNPDVSGKSAETYWAAGQLAQEAGETDQAKQYYQEAIQAARPGNSADQNIVTQAQTALDGLRQ